MDKIAGQIYLILMCNTLKDYIYKVGRSINFYERKKNYNYVKILNVIDSDDIVYDESEIIKIFNKNCKLDKGREFFSTTNDSDFVLNIFLDYFINKIKINTENKNLNITNENNISNIDTIIDENIDTINNIIIKENTDTIINNDNLQIEYICSNINCKKVFTYKSHLKLHLENSYHCNQTIDNIDEYIEEKIKNKKLQNNNIIKEYKCINCNKSYANNFTLSRHQNTSKCNKELYDKKIQLKLLQSQVDDLSKKESKKKLKN